MKLTKEDILKYGTKKEVEFLKEFENSPLFRATGTGKPDEKYCESCGKSMGRITNKQWEKKGKVCDMCEEDIALGRDKE